MHRLQLALTWAVLCKRLRREQDGQAMVESAIVIPLMVFLILGIIQLVMMQHARIMTEYAAFNAARAGIVWNADKFVMESAAIISLLPTYEGLMDESKMFSPTRILQRIMQRALLYQSNRRLSQALSWMRSGTSKMIDKVGFGFLDGFGKWGKKAGKWAGDQARGQLGKYRDQVLNAAEGMADLALTNAITGALGGGDDRMVEVEILNPRLGIAGNVGIGGLGPIGIGSFGNVQGMTGGAFTGGKHEIDFDQFSARAPNRLVIRIRYLYMMRVPFANWVIHQAWLAGRAGKQLYGAVWNPQSRVGETGLRNAGGVSQNNFDDPLLKKLDALGREGIYIMPLTASYTMRMQSNPYKNSVQVR